MLFLLGTSEWVSYGKDLIYSGIPGCSPAQEKMVAFGTIGFERKKIIAILHMLIERAFEIQIRLARGAKIE